MFAIDCPETATGETAQSKLKQSDERQRPARICMAESLVESLHSKQGEFPLKNCATR
jgi:hypothetical protein